LYTETVQLALGGFTFYLPGLSPRRVLAVALWETKTGVGMGSPCTTPVFVEGSIQFWGWFDQPPMRVSRKYFSPTHPWKSCSVSAPTLGLLGKL